MKTLRRFIQHLVEIWRNRPTYEGPGDAPVWFLVILTLLSAFIISLSGYLLDKTLFPFYDTINELDSVNLSEFLALIYCIIVLTWLGVVALLSAWIFADYSLELKRRWLSWSSLDRR